MASGVASSRTARKRILEAFEQLTDEEQMAVVAELWDLVADNGAFGLTEAQRKELDRRVRAYRAGTAVMVPWESVKASLEAKLRSYQSGSKRKPRRT